MDPLDEKTIRITKSIIKIVIKIVIFVVVCIITLGAALYGPYKMWSLATPLEKGVMILRGSSMSPTLSDNTICYTKPWTGERGELIVFRMPPNSGYNITGTLLIKRIIGLPNEAIQVKEDGVYINYELHEEDYTDGTSNIDERNTYNEIQLSDNDYFVMGDNRSDSYDSRAFGAIDPSYFEYAVTMEPNEHTTQVKWHYIWIAIGFVGAAILINLILFFILFHKPKEKSTKVKKSNVNKKAEPKISSPKIKNTSDNNKHNTDKMYKNGVNINTSKKKLKRMKNKK